ncbi:malto-oligosyltrehalose synthase [Nonomuraea roseola]|uniref:Malto-oligosyltrehalose synthase n=1 Tax=Nonomuraea roseola TaxID=46179 RepID=A0ABV5PRP0_9ACTN
MSRPVSTYRVQLTPDFGFAEVAKIAPYLRDLGVSHVYLSPVLQAVPGSLHGYDVVDHSRIRQEFGGAQGFREMAGVLAAHDLAVVVDIVPNHMNTANAQFLSVLEEGAASPYADWFDIEWREGKVIVHRFADDLPQSEHYTVVDWREGPGYRRFFDVSSLIGLRVEDPAVFFATHEVIFWLLDEGLVEGLRIDHPDGLADPRRYLDMLRDRSGGVWTVVEKILIGDERLPDDWACDGTTGYDVLNRVNGLFVDPEGRQPLVALFTAMTGQDADYHAVMARSKRDVIDLFFRSEVERLARVAGASVQDLVDLLVEMPVYRAYVTPGEPVDPVARRIVESAAPNPEIARAVLYGSPEAVVRFQQTCGPVMAKGVEDTALYRWYPLACLNEVGGEPDRFGLSVEDFHDFCAGMRPFTMTTLSTHDTKRSEDVRARLQVLSELPGEWAEAVRGWSRQVSFDPHLDYLAWQTLMAAWPISAERFTDYLLKAAREAKTATSWIAQDHAYEEGLRAFAAKAVELPIGDFTALVDRHAVANSLGQKLVQLMMPGVPDVYQGNERTDFSLVDPDNRRPVSFPCAPNSAWDEAKLQVTTQALRLRRRLGPDAPYEPMAAEGEAAEHAIAFGRGRAVAVATRLPVRLAARGGWGATSLTLPHGSWRDLLTGGLYSGRTPLAHLLSRHPVALLERHDL